MAASWREFLSAWEKFRSYADEYRELDAERVLASGTAAARERRAGWSLGTQDQKGPPCSTYAPGV